ncbi:hypothetical protein M5C97_19165 [Acidovorax sp. NCPPB 3859]|nr:MULTISPECIES: GTPase-associated system all-helical protein GASH [unclassified Acidovorax]MDA8452390.1 hypothetical protein [Acidovorax sp. GBBC 3297]MDA8461831.1 hypothetical protein [Acidovorax sp. GBBC 3333]MDA8466831.1 hypothetical protein [Acidovorax sp. GBBC 3332]MDA8471900.1 hypothetical protein [Acidovorax sp. GBBC 3299]WCM77611.1 hypothetical protein M5C94_19115 [Acidovorax sp. GBBC 712]
MSAAVLQAFMQVSLIDLDGEDTRLNKLQAASVALADEFSAKPISMAIPSLIAILRADDKNPADAFDDTARVIGSQWATYQSVFRDGKANTLYRGVALQALVAAIESEPSLGTAIALLMRNFKAVVELGKYAAPIKLLADAAEAAFTKERGALAVPAQGTRTKLPSAIKATKIDRAKLLTRIEAAVGPHNRAGNAGENPNPHWSDAGHPWSHDFSDRLMPIIADHIDIAIAEAAKFDERNLQSVANSIAALSTINPEIQRSTKLLWWRQSLYSESADKSYRLLSAADAVVHLVADLSRHLPDAYERAVESFLSEAVLAVGLGSDEHAISVFQGADAQARTALRDCLAFPSPAGLAMTDIVKRSGVDPICAPTLTYQGWAVWLLRELMAVRAVQEIQKTTEAEDAANE